MPISIWLPRARLKRRWLRRAWVPTEMRWRGVLGGRGCWTVFYKGGVKGGLLFLLIRLATHSALVSARTNTGLGWS